MSISTRSNRSTTMGSIAVLLAASHALGCLAAMAADKSATATGLAIEGIAGKPSTSTGSTLTPIVAPTVTPTPPATATETGAASQETKAQGVSDQINQTNQTNQINQSNQVNDAVNGAESKMLVKPGQPIAVTMEQEDLTPTDDVALAKKQVLAYPDSPEASFILAVALTRTSRLEEALQEVRRARRLAANQGGAEYFNKMISQYEKMLEYCPYENRVRYGLAWAYYMKAWLLGHAHPAQPKVANTATAASVQNPQASKPQGKEAWANAGQANQVLALISPNLAKSVPNVPGAISSSSLPKLPSALEQASPDAVPQIKQYYESALKHLDDLLARNPKDIWAKVYRAYLYNEYTGDLKGAMKVWSQCQAESPNNPAPYFFLGTGYMSEGNLKESLSNISRAIALRAVGN